MHTADSLWQKTEAGRFLDLFPAYLADLLSSAGTPARDSVISVLPHIFWRWYFLQLPVVPETSAYWQADFCREREKWPAGGQFCPRVSGEIAGGNLSVTVDLDYIGFLEQPFLADLKRLQADQPLLYGYDERYRQDLRFVGDEWAKRHGPFSTDEDGRDIAVSYLEICLGVWYVGSRDIASVFQPDEWISFWSLLLREAAGEEGLSTDRLLDAYVSRMREYLPDYGLMSEELEEVTQRGIGRGRVSKQVKEQFYFWEEFSQYVLVPFSLYWNLLAPLYMDHELLADDVAAAARSASPQPEMFNAPCTVIWLTPFGRQVFL